MKLHIDLGVRIDIDHAFLIGVLVAGLCKVWLHTAVRGRRTRRLGLSMRASNILLFLLLLCLCLLDFLLLNINHREGLL